jgi:peptidoglycan/LPS O-acetylase OafA/YrhL
MDSDNRLNVTRHVKTRALSCNQSPRLMPFFGAKPIGKGERVSTNESRIKYLDGFRGVAVLSIVVLHYLIHHLRFTPGSMFAYGQKYLMFLWIGVDAFFVLSGFLIGGILMDQREATNYFSVFYLRRALRIFPPYVLLLACWVLASAVAGVPGMRWLLEPRFSFWPFAFYAQNFVMAAHGSTGPNFVAATWSLAIEEQFYLLFPLMVGCLSPTALPRVVVGGVILAPTLRLALGFLGPQWHEAQVLLLPTRWDSLLLGALVAWSVRRPGWVERLRRNRVALLTLLCASGFLVAGCPGLPDRPGPMLAPLLALAVHLVIAAFFATLLLVLHIGILPRATAILSTGVLRYFGRISYTMYLFHTAVLGLCFALILGIEPNLAKWTHWVVTLFAFGLTVSFAHLSWEWLEARLVRFGHRFGYMRVERNTEDFVKPTPN